MRSPVALSCLFALLPLVSTSALAEDKPAYTNFRVGVGSFRLDIDPAASYLTDAGDRGSSLFAEFPQSEHAASRFIMYRYHGDDKDLTGFETQLMWGWGLASEGARLYTGPAWHREKMAVERSSGSGTRVFNGWGWQLGAGYQVGAITVDVAATWRDNEDYDDENHAAGHDYKRPNVWFRNLLISYRF